MIEAENNNNLPLGFYHIGLTLLFDIRLSNCLKLLTNLGRMWELIGIGPFVTAFIVTGEACSVAQCSSFWRFAGCH